MSEPFEKQEAAKLKDMPLSDAAAEKRIDLVAEKAAEKPAITGQLYDEDHPIFSK